MAMELEPDRVLDSERLRLLKDKLGILFSWRAPAIVQTIGPFDPSVFEHFANERQSLVDRYVAKLQSYSDGDLAVILRTANERGPGLLMPDARSSVEKDWADFLVGETHELRRRIPEWYAGGFGHPDHTADFDYWARMPGFSESELTCLSVGISPAEFSGERLADLRRSKERAKLPKPLEFLVQRFELITRTFDFRYNTASPLDIVEWVDQFEVSMHRGFLDSLRKYNSMNGVDRASAVTAKSDNREMNSMAKLVTVLAIKKFRYDPNATRSDVPKRIADIAAEYGIQISEDTVRKFLRRGADFIAKDRQDE